MRNRTAACSLVTIVSGFAVSLMGALLMGREAVPKVVAGLLIAVGVLSVFVGVVVYMVTSIIYLVSKGPKYETGAAVEGEYSPLIESGEMEEVPASLPARRTLSGAIGKVPIVVRLYFTPRGGYTGSRTEFFSPFGVGGREKPFRLYPSGREVRSDLGVHERFALAFYVPKSDYGAFKRSGLTTDAMGALLDFQDENGGVLSMDGRGLFWSVDRLDLGGLGSDIAREFAEVSKIVSDSLERRAAGSNIGDAESVPEELVYNPGRGIVGPSQPTYATKRTLIGITTALLAIGGFCLLGAVGTYGGDRETFITLAAISAFTLTPGVVMLPILIYHIVTSRRASKP